METFVFPRFVVEQYGMKSSWEKKYTLFFSLVDKAKQMLLPQYFFFITFCQEWKKEKGLLHVSCLHCDIHFWPMICHWLWIDKYRWHFLHFFTYKYLLILVNRNFNIVSFLLKTHWKLFYAISYESKSYSIVIVIE